MRVFAQASSEPGLGRGALEAHLERFVSGLGEDLGRVVVVVPDSTRTAPLPLVLPLLCDRLEPRARELTVLVALGTHRYLSPAELDELVGADLAARARAGRLGLLNHEWADDARLVGIGRIGSSDLASLSAGLLAEEVEVRVNRLVAEADHVVICGPVFPHEVAGFSGGNKYLFPGVSGPEVIGVTHWIGALVTSAAIIGTLGPNPVRAVIDRAAALVPAHRSCIALVVEPGSGVLLGLEAGEPAAAWAAAAARSAQVHVRYLDAPVRRVVSLVQRRYDDLWTGAKGFYKVEPVVADGGEVLIVAPHITELSTTHGAEILRVGYHCRDYFLAAPERFADVSRTVLAHSTHVRGDGHLDGAGSEHPRISLTLASGISREVCEAVGLGYLDPATLDVEALAAEDDTLVVDEAGEYLYRLRAGALGPVGSGADATDP